MRLNILISPAIVLSLFFISSCKKDTGDSKPANINFRQEMRTFVQEISLYARTQKQGFIIIPQNGQELLTVNGEADGFLQNEYIGAIDGIGREDLFYGYDNDDILTAAVETDYMLSFCTRAKNNGLKVLVTDYCFTPSKIQDSFTKNFQKGFISFAATHRELDAIPAGTPYNQNPNNIAELNEANNFLYLINIQLYSVKQQFLNAVAATNYDVIIMDAFFTEGNNNTIWTVSEINQLKTKANGGNRLVIAYMSIGEAEDYRYYWQKSWNGSKPAWLGDLNPDWPGNYNVHYWMPDWKQVITGNSSSYIQKIIDAGFDGTYLDIIDGFEYWENL